MASVNKIKETLEKYNHLKCEMVKIKNDLNVIAYELGLNQKCLGKVSIVDFLDGYLVANGIIQSYRLLEE